MKHLMFLLLPCLWSMGQNFQTVSYSEDAKIIEGAVHDIEQDGTGRMWFLSSRGIATYDGRRWLKQDDGLIGLPRDIAIDHNNRRWVLTNHLETPLSYQDDDLVWHALARPKDYRPIDRRLAVETLTLDDDDIGVFVSTGRDVFMYRKQAWTRLSHKGESLRINHLSKRHNRLYLSGASGCFSFKNQQLIPLNETLTEARDDVIAMVPDVTSERVFVIGKYWLGAFVEDQYHRLLDFSDRIQRNLLDAADAAPDGHGGLLFGDFSDVLHYDRAGKLAIYNGRTGFEASELLRIYLDRENILWVGGRSGVKKLLSFRFGHYDQRQGLIIKDVASIFREADGRLLIGQNMNFLRFNGQRFEVLDHDLPMKQTARIFRIISDGKRGAWAAVWGLGLVHIEGDQVRFKDTWAMNDIFSLTLGEGGTLYVGGGSGLKRLVNDRLEPFLPDTFKHAARDLAYRPEDGLWAATVTGFFRIQGTSVIRYTASSEQGNNCTGIYFARDGRVLVGTYDWVHEVKGNRLEPTDLFEYVSRPVFFIEGTLENLWLGSDSGVYHFDGLRIRQFTSEQGFRGRDCNRGACVVAPDGRVYIGTEKGMSVYNPLYDTTHPITPLLNLDSIRWGGQDYAPDEALSLSYGEQDIIFAYRAISFVDERDLEYQFILEGYDSRWQTASGGDSSRYTMLPPGDYRFRVKARSAGSDWTPALSSARLTVLKPFWKRAWFVLLIGVLVIALIYSVIEYYSSKRYSRYLERQVELRTSELSRKTRELEAQVGALRRAEAQMNAMNEELEARVAERTEELEMAHRDLVETAHYEGMAEIANSIIHNVGNILNSISTSGYVIQEKVETSKLKSLERAEELVSQHKGELDHFMRNDPKAMMLLELYLNLAHIYRKERKTLLYHCQLMLEKVGTIKDVISQQHNYASGVYQRQTMDPIEIVEISIKIISASWEGQGIEIIKNFEPCPAIAVQKTRFIHTMVNLLKNAKESMLAIVAGPKRITVTISNQAGDVLISVADHGVGIPAKNLNRIFNHGFTTKQNGHGFGLHSCANAISEMGGMMWAESDGEGLGAQFYIKLPVAEMRSGQTETETVSDVG